MVRSLGLPLPLEFVPCEHEEDSDVLIAFQVHISMTTIGTTTVTALHVSNWLCMCVIRQALVVVRGRPEWKGAQSGAMRHGKLSGCAPE